MAGQALSLLTVFDGWAGHQQALMSAVIGLTPEQLAWSGGEHLRSAGELIGHIAIGRVSWIHDVLGVESDATQQWLAEACTETPAGHRLKPDLDLDADLLAVGLEATWEMIESALSKWRALFDSFNHLV